MKKLLEEEDKAAAAVSQKKKLAKSGKERRRAAAAVATALKDKDAEAEAASQAIQCSSVLSQDKEEDSKDGLPDESSAKGKRKSKKKQEGDQDASASKTAPWATAAKEAGAAAEGVGVEAKSATQNYSFDAESFFLAKFNLSPSDVSSGAAWTDTTALGPAAAPEEESAPGESMSRTAPPAPAARTVVCFTYQALSIATNNFEKRLGSGGCGSVFQGVLVSGTCVAVKRLELDVVPGAGQGWLSQMGDQMRTEVEVLSQVQHVNIVPLLGSSKDGMAACLVYAFMEGGSLQDRLACRGSGAVPLTANERILLLSDVARGLAYLHSEVRVIHRDVKSANVLLDRGCRGRIGDFGIAKSLKDNHAGISATYIHTAHVLGTQVYMAPEYIKGDLSMKVDAFAFGLVVLETLTGYAICSPAPGHGNLLSMFEQELDTPSKLLAHLDKRACWDQHKQERVGRLHSIADRCLEARRNRRPELVELIPELEEVRRGTESLQVEILDRLGSLDSFQCPLTMEVMTDPVITADGQTYERTGIESWFALGKRTSPLTGAA